jgi:polysaccharide deacetylase family protein (PEP-CTERM system associated)
MESQASHILSFDFEEWFHIFGQNPKLHRERWDDLPARLPGITESILDLLDQHRAKATFFCLGWVASRYPELIRDIADAGHEVAAHSYWHEKVNRQTISTFRNDLLRNTGELEDITGKKVVSYRAPAFTLFPVSGEAVEILLESGIRVDSSIMSGVRYKNISIPNSPFTLHSGQNSLIYYPVSTFNLLFKRIPYAGSGYFRVLPFGLVRSKLAKPGYHMLYFHPRDLDSGMNRVREFSAMERLRFLPGTKSSLSNLGKLLEVFRMTSISVAVDKQETTLLVTDSGK